MKKVNNKFKKGAASFYIVAFSTLILVIIAVSFASVIIRAITNTSNDELAQSAYDSALAGVEDAKLAYANYIKCKEKGFEAAGSEPGPGAAVDDCRNIIYWMENPNCDMVGRILGRITQPGEVIVRESTTASGSGDNNLQQAYTCVKIDQTPPDFRSTLSSTNPTQVIPITFAKDDTAQKISKIRVSWYSSKDTAFRDFTNIIEYNNTTGAVGFYSLKESSASMPPTLMVSLVQTGQDFTMDSFTKVDLGSTPKTNRATVYLVPTDKEIYAKANYNLNTTALNYIGTRKNNESIINAINVAKTNDQTGVDKPFLVYCNDSVSNAAGMICSVDIELPQPLNGFRSNETFAMMVSIPYAQPSTDFSLQFLCNDSSCSTSQDGIDIINNSDGNVATLKNIQISIDSTGRANNLYRRVETYLQSSDSRFSVPFYAIQLLGPNNLGLKKDMTVTSEWGTY